MKEFLAWMDTTFPPVPGVWEANCFLRKSDVRILCFVFWHTVLLRSYVTTADLQAAGEGTCLRPWHLSWKPDAGFRGYAEPAKHSEAANFGLFISV